MNMKFRGQGNFGDSTQIPQSIVRPRMTRRQSLRVLPQVSAAKATRKNQKNKIAGKARASDGFVGFAADPPAGPAASLGVSAAR